MWRITLVLISALSLGACDRPPLPKTGDTVQGQEDPPSVTGQGHAGEAPSAGTAGR